MSEEIQASTSYKYPTKFSRREDWNFLLNVSSSISGQRECELTDITAHGQGLSFVRNCMLDNILMKNIIHNLWNAVKYGEEYSAFLLGNTSIDDFKQIAQSYAQEVVEVDNDKLHYAVRFCLEHVSNELSTSDISQLLNVDVKRIEPGILNIK